MHLLPALACGGCQRLLPFSDYTAVRVAAALLAEHEADRLRLLEAAISDDPPLALWIAALAWTKHQCQPRTPLQMAQWMTPQRWNFLAQHVQPAAAEDSAKRAQWAGLLRAALCARFARGGGSDDVLAAILHNARQWLAAGLAGAAEGRRLDAILPPWLVDPIAAEGLQPTPPPEEEAPAGQGVHSGGGPLASPLVEQWHTSIGCAGELLKGAARQLANIDARQREDDGRRLREKLASLKEFTYGASHELNNPLFNISSRAQVLMRDEQDPERRKKLATIYSHAMRASEMINDIALAARPPAPKFTAVDAVEIVREVVEELLPSATEQGASFPLEMPLELPLEADPTQLAVVVREICLNAVESLQRSGRKGVISVRLAADGADAVEIAVQDNGPGLDERSWRHLFDPFYSGYESGRGFGFGLTKCWQIVEAHRGRIAVDSQPGRGTTLTVRLPRKQAPHVPGVNTAGETPK